MKLEVARQLIQSAPDTWLRDAALVVLAELEKGDPGRVEAAARVTALEAELRSRKVNEQRALEERDRLIRELEAVRAPDPDLPRLRELEAAVRGVVNARAPVRTEGRVAFDYIVSHLRPYLDP